MQAQWLSVGVKSTYKLIMYLRNRIWHFRNKPTHQPTDQTDLKKEKLVFIVASYCTVFLHISDVLRYSCCLRNQTFLSVNTMIDQHLLKKYFEENTCGLLSGTYINVIPVFAWMNQRGLGRSQEHFKSFRNASAYVPDYTKSDSRRP